MLTLQCQPLSVRRALLRKLLLAEADSHGVVVGGSRQQRRRWTITTNTPPCPSARVLKLNPARPRQKTRLVVSRRWLTHIHGPTCPDGRATAYFALFAASTMTFAAVCHTTQATSHMAFNIASLPRLLECTLSISCLLSHSNSI